MKWISQALIILMVAIYSMAASAEGGCPDGQYPQQGPGWRTCVPIPGAQTDTTTARPVRWKSYWSAIAVDYSTASLGSTTSADTEDGAKASAKSDCLAKGGSKCEVLVTVRNACMAMVVGKKFLNAQGGKTKEDAEQRAMTSCSADDTGCTVYYSSCGLPEKIEK